MYRRLLLLLAMACALLAGACGDDDVDVAKTLQQTFGEDKNIKSGRLDLGLQLDASGLAALAGPISVSLSGPFASSGGDQLPRFDVEAELKAGGRSVKAGAVSTGEKGFVSFQGQAYVLSDALYKQFKDGYAEQVKNDKGEETGVSFKSLGVDPQRWLRDPKSDGREEVGGVETIKIKAGIDVSHLLEDVNRILGRAEQLQGQAGQRARQLTEAERKQIADAIKDARIELWTGDEDKILRKLNVQLKFEVPEAARSKANGLESGTIKFDLSLGAINEEQKFSEPEDAQPFEDFIAALSGGSGAGSQPAPQSGGSAYDECVAAAGADISKLQACAG